MGNDVSAAADISQAYQIPQATAPPSTTGSIYGGPTGPISIPTDVMFTTPATFPPYVAPSAPKPYAPSKPFTPPYKYNDLPSLAFVNLPAPESLKKDTTFSANLKSDANNFSLDKILSKTYLKKACCSNDNYIEIPIYDKTSQQNLGTYSIGPIDLTSICNNLDGDGVAYKKIVNSTDDTDSHRKCSNFLKTYCKTLKTYHPDNVYYHRYGLNTAGLECGCLNSDLPQYLRSGLARDSTIACIDTKCAQDKSWKLPSMIKSSCDITICQQDINVADAQKVNIADIKFSQECGRTTTTGGTDTTTGTGGTTGTTGTGGTGTGTTTGETKETKTQTSDTTVKSQTTVEQTKTPTQTEPTSELLSSWTTWQKGLLAVGIFIVAMLIAYGISKLRQGSKPQPPPQQFSQQYSSSGGSFKSSRRSSARLCSQRSKNY